MRWLHAHTNLWQKTQFPLRTREGDAPQAILSLSSGSSTAIMILTETPNEIAVMEMERGGSANFYTLTRAEEPISNWRDYTRRAQRGLKSAMVTEIYTSSATLLCPVS